MKRALHGFTLVELLVVITIIGILLGLLIPAVNMVREQGRQTTCLNNQMQIAKAILNYETDKRRLPGVLDQLSSSQGVAYYNWVEALFPYLEHADMWESVVNNNVAQIHQMRVKEVVCPNDPYLVNVTAVTAQALLSYGVNDQFFVSYLGLKDSTANPPLDRTGKTSVAPASTSKLTDRTVPRGQSVTPSTTIMLGERTGDGTAKYPRAGNVTFPTAGPWTTVPTVQPATVATAATAWTALTFQWPSAPVPLSPSIMVSAHPGIVIAVFFDGHGEKIANDTVYPSSQ